MVYVDDLFQMASKKQAAFMVGKRHCHKWCHLYADTLEELIKFGIAIGLKRSWLQNDSGRFPHFDLVPTLRQQAIANGAMKMSFKEFIKLKRGD